MSLSDLEKKAGRIFRAGRQSVLDDLNAASPPGGEADPLHRVDRHACPHRGGASIGIELTEYREASGLYRVCYCGCVALVTAPEGDFPHEDCGASKIAAEAGLLTFVWKEGRCPDCGLVLRSHHGRVALTADLQPLKERKVVG
jgi:hypothetical protein